MLSFQKTLPVLMYHQITDSGTPSSLKIPPQDFSRQIDWLEKKNFCFVSLKEVVDKGGRVPWSGRSIALTFDDGFRDNGENAFSHLLKRGRTATLFVVVNWVGQKGFLDWNEIQDLSQAGIEIGSHSLTHRWLPDLSDSSELRQEIFDSKKRIEDRIGREVQWFCYPVGGVDQRVADEVERAGYLAAWVAGARPTVAVRNSRYSLRRIKITPRDANLSRFSIKSYGLKSLFF